VGGRQNRDVRLAQQEHPAGRADTLVDTVHALGETRLLPGVDIIRQFLALAEPSLLQSVSEGLQFGNQLCMLDLQWAVDPNLLQFWRVDPLVIVVGGGLGLRVSC